MEKTIDIPQEEKAVSLIQEQHGNAVAIFSSGANQFYSSFTASTQAEKAKLLNAMQNPTYKLDQVEKVNVIMAQDIVAHKVQLTDMNTGEAIIADRIIIVCPNGETVAGVSKGFKGGISNIMNVFGQPSTWESPLPLYISSVKTRNGNNTYNINVLFDSPLPKIGEIKKGGK